MLSNSTNNQFPSVEIIEFEIRGYCYQISYLPIIDIQQ